MLLATWQIVAEVPSTYESRAVLILSERAARGVDAMQPLFTALRQQATRGEVLESIVENRHLRGENESTDSAINRLRGQITIEARLPVIAVSYRNNDPRVAQSVVEDAVSAFDRTNDAIRKRTTAEASWLDTQIKKTESQLAELGLSGSVAAFATPGATADPRAARALLVAAMDTLNDRQYALEQQIAEQERQIREQRGSVESAGPVSGPQDAAYGALLVRKAELEAQLLGYASQYTDKNVKVVQARTQLSEIERQLVALEAKNQPASAATAPAVRELLALERDLVRLRTDLEITERDIRRKTAALESLPRSDSASSDKNGTSKTEITSAPDRLLNRYGLLLEQRDLVEKAGLLDRESPPVIQISDPPSFPQEPSGPNRRILGLIALAFSLATGLLVGAIPEVRRFFVVQDHRDVVYFLELPVLGSIPETLTSGERSSKWRYMLARTLGAVLLVSVTPAGVLALKHFDLLKHLLPF